MDLIKVAEQAFATGKQHPQFFPGDTITVAYRIKEGNKERIQQYSISINKHGKVRRAKLYYLRGLTGKKARIKERRIIKKEEA